MNEQVPANLVEINLMIDACMVAIFSFFFAICPISRQPCVQITSNLHLILLGIYKRLSVTRLVTKKIQMAAWWPF